MASCLSSQGPRVARTRPSSVAPVADQLRSRSGDSILLQRQQRVKGLNLHESSRLFLLSTVGCRSTPDRLPLCGAVGGGGNKDQPRFSLASGVLVSTLLEPSEAGAARTSRTHGSCLCREEGEPNAYSGRFYLLHLEFQSIGFSTCSSEFPDKESLIRPPVCGLQPSRWASAWGVPLSSGQSPTVHRCCGCGEKRIRRTPQNFGR